MDVKEALTLADDPETESHSEWCTDARALKLLAAELRKRQWVSVKDALPANYRDVMILNGCGVGIAWRSDKGWNAGYLPDKDPPPTLDEAIAQNQITHWMPLPEPPEGA